MIPLLISLIAGCKMGFLGKTSPDSLSIPDALTLSGPLFFQAGVCSSAVQVGGLVSKTGEHVNLPAGAQVVVEWGDWRWEFGAPNKLNPTGLGPLLV